MKNTLKVINRMVKKGLFNDYAIGGGIAAMFYIEPFLTYDLDVFVLLEQPKEKIVSLTNVYEYLTKAGYKWKGEHIIIEGIPVQFIPADELETEAITKSRYITYEGIKTKVISPEYLVAILLRAGRKKDIEKIEKIIEEVKVNKKILNDILTRYNLIKQFSLLTKR